MCKKLPVSDKRTDLGLLILQWNLNHDNKHFFSREIVLEVIHAKCCRFCLDMWIEDHAWSFLVLSLQRVWLTSYQKALVVIRCYQYTCYSLGAVAVYKTSAWNVSWICFPLSYFSIIQSFSNFAQGTTVILPCPAQNFKMIGYMRGMVWSDKILWDLASRWVSSAYSI